MTSEQIIRRSDILNTQVITRDNGKRLGIVSQIWVDVDQREVVALSLRDNLISVSGVPRYMYLNSINQMGDVILVNNEDAIDDIEVEAFSNLTNWEVITETGEVLGKVRGFKFHGETGKITSITIASFGLPQIPDQILSTYELSVEEIVSTGPNRLIVFEGAEERVNQLTVGILERLGIGRAPWDREDSEEYGSYTPRTMPVSQQLPPGVPLESPKPKTIRRAEPIAREEEWDDDYIEERQERQERKVMKAQQYEPVQYEDDEEEDNWSEATGKDRYQKSPKYEPAPYNNKQYDEDDYDDDLQSDAWADESPKPVNIPKRVKEKQPEYEEEGGY